MATKKLLIETLNQLSPEDFAEFKSVIEVDKKFASFSKSKLKAANTQDVVELMEKTYGRGCVEETREALMKMSRSDLVQRLSGITSGTKHKQFPALSQRVETMGSLIELLLETLAHLSGSEFKKFKQALRKNRGLFFQPRETEASDLQDTVFSMVQTFGQHSVKMTMDLLKDIERSDVAQRLSDCSSEPKEKRTDEQLSALIHKVATMAAVKELLLETLKDLSLQDLWKFKGFLKFTCFKMGLPQIKTYISIEEELVDQMVDKLGQLSVEVTREVLTDMERPDLVQKVSESSSGLKEKHSEDERWPALIHGVETMASVIELLLETLAALNDQELEEFKQVMLQILHYSDSTDFLLHMMADLEGTVFLMVQTYGQQSVQMTMTGLNEMKRTDLAQRLSDCSSLCRKKHSVDDRRSALIHKVATMAAVKHLLLGTLNDLSNEEFKKFKRFMPVIFPRKNLLNSSWRLESSDKAEFVDLMVDELGQRSVETTRKVFLCMKRTDLIQKLPESSSGSREKLSVDEHEAALLKREEAKEAVRQILFDTLKRLRFEDLNKFSLFLKFTCFKMGLPQLQRYINMARELADQMVDKLGQQSVEAAREVLTDMKRPDLVQRLSESSSGLKGRETGRSSESEDYGSVIVHSQTLSVKDSSDWTKLEPEVNGRDADEAPTYSLQSGAGHFECSVSGLRWVCKEKASFQYQFSSWEGHMERMESRGYMPAGPLMGVTVTAGKLYDVHLPHWICTDDIPGILDKFAVLHIDDCGDVVEKVSEVTPSHVKLMGPNFSLIGALISLFFLPPKISCYMLMYYKPNTSFLKLHVYPIRQDPALEQIIDKRESKIGFNKIIKHHPDKYLQTEHSFSLKANVTIAKIQPEVLTLRYNSQNLYEVYIENLGSDLILTLQHTYPVIGEPGHDPVWTCEIRQDDHPESGLVEEKHCVDEHLSAQLQEALTFQSDREKLLGMFEDLKREEFEKFKWFLRDRDVLLGLRPIPESQLEAPTACELVDLMLKTYTQHTVEVTKKVFRKINRNDLVQKFSDSSS